MINQYLSIIRSETRLFSSTTKRQVSFISYIQCFIMSLEMTVRLHWFIPSVKGVYFLFCVAEQQRTIPARSYSVEHHTNVGVRPDNHLSSIVVCQLYLYLCLKMNVLIIHWCFNATCCISKSTNTELISPSVTWQRSLFNLLLLHIKRASASLHNGPS